jgi:MscS family membrane protein
MRAGAVIRFATVGLVALLVMATPIRADGTLKLTDSNLALLSAPDLTSPRATMFALSDSVDRAYEVLSKAFIEYRADPAFGPADSVISQVTLAELLLRRAVATLDLSQVLAIGRRQTGMQTVLLLQGILDRLPVTPAAAIPGAQAVKTADAAGTPITDWTVPFSDLHIVRMTEGPNAGHFLFSARTVARAEEFHKSIKRFAERADSKGATHRLGPDFFDFFTLTPGDLLPPKWYLWIERLPEWTRTTVAGQTLWQWAGLAVVLVVAFGLLWGVSRLRRPRPAVPPATPMRAFGSRLVMPIALIIASSLILYFTEELNITGWPFVAVSIALHTISYLAAARAAYLICTGTGEWIISSPRIDPTSIDASLLRISTRMIGIAAGVGLIFYGATEIGIPVFGVVAGLGVGGLALGLAARPTLENLIGGLILYADRPVRVGDFCQFGTMMGTVEEIGLRSTRIRALDRTLISISNAEFSNMQIINYTLRDRTLLNTTIGLRYETTPEQMNAVLDGIRKLLRGNPDVAHDTIRVRFRKLGDYSLDVEVFAYINHASIGDFLEVQEGLLLAFMKVVEDCGTAIAFPSQTTYHVDGTKGLGGIQPVPPASG